MAWQFVTACGKVSADAPVAFESGDIKIAVYKVKDDFYATDNVCPHAFALMTDGFVEGDTVECPLHGAIFHIPTGKCMAAPADSDLKTYPVKVEDNQVFVDL
jgi:3-phenylpropionate/trans-cinnamate dioxygenase ferredoxin component